jgi:hypothetical protein
MKKPHQKLHLARQTVLRLSRPATFLVRGGVGGPGFTESCESCPCPPDPENSSGCNTGADDDDKQSVVERGSRAC